MNEQAIALLSSILFALRVLIFGVFFIIGWSFFRK